MTESVFSPAYQQVLQTLIGLRQRAGLSQRELARRLGRERSFVSRVEKGERRVDLVEFCWICRACDADPRQEAAALYEALEKYPTPSPGEE